jgi:uncharacterized protein (TIGR02453 family)
MKSEPRFSGFPRECVKFYRELKANNSKSWFTEHKDEYNEYVLEPARLFVVEMGERLRALSPAIQADPRIDKSIFRIFRDTRFSKDKSPYKTHLGIWFWEGSGDRMECSGFYMHVEPPNLMLAAGLYRFPAHVVDEYRHSVVDGVHGVALEKAVRAVTRNPDCRVGKESFKRVPRGFDPDHKRANYLRHDTLYCWTESRIPKELYSETALDYCFREFRSFLPLHEWLVELIARSES